jgi:hypothetical protein
MSDGSNHNDILTLIEGYVPLLALPLRYLWVGLTESRWFTPPNFAFGLPLTLTSFAMIAVSALRVFEDFPLQITSHRLIVVGLAGFIWVGAFYFQMIIQREYRAAPKPAQWICLVGWADFIGVGTYILFVNMLHTVA